MQVRISEQYIRFLRFFFVIIYSYKEYSIQRKEELKKVNSQRLYQIFFSYNVEQALKYGFSISFPKYWENMRRILQKQFCTLLLETYEYAIDIDIINYERATWYETIPRLSSLPLHYVYNTPKFKCLVSTFLAVTVSRAILEKRHRRSPDKNVKWTKRHQYFTNS